MPEVRHYYNEFDHKAAVWLRELMANGLIPQGEVDERSITEVQSADLVGFTSCHFFAGIGGWPYALRLAGWPDDRPVWTGSCPCQPYSAAGKRLGDKDARNLWPHFFRLIRECRPDYVFGEQVESAIRYGWLDGVQADLEGEGYAVGHCVLGAHSVGAPHIRQRLYWVADAEIGRHDRGPEGSECSRRDQLEASRSTNGLAHSGGERPLSATHTRVSGEKESGVQQRGRVRRRLAGCGGIGGMGDAIGSDIRGHARNAPCPQGCGNSGGEVDGAVRVEPERSGSLSGLEYPESGGTPPAEQPGQRGISEPPSFWDAHTLILCRDGKQRRAEPTIFPLAHGVSNRVGLLRGAGNAIVPQTAAAFVQAFLETKGD